MRKRTVDGCRKSGQSVSKWGYQSHGSEHPGGFWSKSLGLGRSLMSSFEEDNLVWESQSLVQKTLLKIASPRDFQRRGRNRLVWGTARLTCLRGPPGTLPDPILGTFWSLEHIGDEVQKRAWDPPQLVSLASPRSPQRVWRLENRKTMTFAKGTSN